jgi:hypothetical protein
MGLCTIDHKNHLITLSVITLSGFHCIIIQLHMINFNFLFPSKSLVPNLFLFGQKIRDCGQKSHLLIDNMLNQSLVKRWVSYKRFKQVLQAFEKGLVGKKCLRALGWAPLFLFNVFQALLVVGH